MKESTIRENNESAAAAVVDADALLFTAGAGMGVDSGLPDFRGNDGFWRAYPPYARLGLRFEQLANPARFDDDPHLAWGFYGHRLGLYRDTKPHAGFGRLLELGKTKPGGYRVFTSNVDGHFLTAGFPADRVVECHGSINHLQCGAVFGKHMAGGWDGGRGRSDHDAGRRPAAPVSVLRAVARPNILMFGDGRWVSDRTDEQESGYAAWRRSGSTAGLVVIECGAGTAIPTVRMESEASLQKTGATLVRINVRDTAVPRGQIAIPLPAVEAIERICNLVGIRRTTDVRDVAGS